MLDPVMNRAEPMCPKFKWIVLQTDLPWTPIKTDPSTANTIVLVLGEPTGQSHKILSPSAWSMARGYNTCSTSILNALANSERGFSLALFGLAEFKEYLSKGYLISFNSCKKCMNMCEICVRNHKFHPRVFQVSKFLKFYHSIKVSQNSKIP